MIPPGNGKNRDKDKVRHGEMCTLLRKRFIKIARSLHFALGRYLSVLSLISVVRCLISLLVMGRGTEFITLFFSVCMGMSMQF